MINSRRRFSQAAMGVCVAAMLPRVARAAAWPDKPITCVIGFAPGGGMDYVMRSLAPDLGARLGQPMVVNNKPGAGSIIAASYAARSAPDGYTVFGSDGSAPVLNSALYANLPYDPAKDFAPVTLLVRVPLMLVAHPDVPAEDLASFVALSKSTSLSYASAGKGSYHHLAMELLKRKAGFEAVEVPFKGAGPAMQAVLAGHVPVAPLDAGIALPNLRAGKLKVLAVLSQDRMAQLPKVPTAAEQGVAGVEAFAWSGVFVPTGTPQNIVDRLSAELRNVLHSPEILARFKDLGMIPVGNNPEEFRAFVADEIRRWHPLIKELGIQIA